MPASFDVKAILSAPDPHPTYSALRDADNDVVFLDQRVWVAARHQAVREVLTSSDTFSRHRAATNARADILLPGTALPTPGPEDTERLNTALAGRAGSAALTLLRDTVEEQAAHVVAQAMTAGHICAVADLVVPLVTRTLTVLAGHAPGGDDQLQALAMGIIDIAEPSLTPTSRAYPLAVTLHAALAASKSETRLPPLAALALAGADLAVHSATNLLYRLALHHRLWGALCSASATEQSLSAAYRESLRLDPPVQWVCRETIRTTKVGASLIPRGQLVLALLGAAGRDTVCWGHDADQFNPERHTDQRPLLLSLDIGDALGRARDAFVQMQVLALLRALSRSCPHMVVDDTPDRHHGALVRGWKRLPLTLHDSRGHPYGTPRQPHPASNAAA